MAAKKKTFFDKPFWRTLSQVLISGSVIAIILSGLGYLGTDLWLNSTTWLVVAGVLAGLGVYTRLEV